MDAQKPPASLLRELEQLRQENARLSRLLELRGDTVPADEQPAIPVYQPGMVTHDSPTADKLALYTDLFRARRDVYALRWENHRTGRQGWSPAIAGGWARLVDKKRARHLPLTNDVLVAHLTGDVFVGLYPLLPGGECHWLAADFDGPTAMLDALAYTKAGRSRGVPAALELSQSGRGAHVWIFFSGPVKAAAARVMGAWLVHEAMLLRGSMDLRSYDRLFPNQDVVPEGGFGNLIAAPLQGSRRASGLTLFLDSATLEPHADQWAFLSTLGRLSPGEVLRFARGAPRSTAGVEVKAIEPSSATSVNPPLPPVIRAELGAGLVIPTAQLTPAALATFKHTASMVNPKFYELQRLRKSTWDTPRFVRGYDLTLDDRLVLPRGLRHTISALLDRSGAKLDITDLRQSGTEIDVSLAAELQDAQAEAVGELLSHDDGVLVAPPGSGKTVMACAMIAERGASTLVLVDRKALAEQWSMRVEQFLGVRPGQLGGGRKKLTGVIDIAMLPSLARRDDVADFTGGYGQVIVDECHHLGAAAYEHSVKPITARYWLGLTATLTRRDGLADLVTWQLGPVRHTFDVGRDRDTLLDIRAERGPQLRLHLHDTAFAHGDLDLSAPGAYAGLLGVLIDDTARNDQIVGDVAEALSRGRNCVVLTRRVRHVETFARVLTHRGFSPLLLRGGMSVAERRAVIDLLADVKAGDGVLVIGTTPFMGEGFDAPALDTLFLAGPIAFDGHLVQCVGRVIRTFPGKEVAEVHDYHDAQAPILAAGLRRRVPGYRSLGFTYADGRPV